MTRPDPLPPRCAALLSPFIERLQALFAEIDAAYTAAADQCGFVCTGCEENCCRTRFHHHTLVEFGMLKKGVEQMPAADRAAAVRRARLVLDAYAEADRAGSAPRVMCPLNVDQRCLLYPHRPMICRMHGIANVLYPDGRTPVYGPGCAVFDERCRKTTAALLDRTPFYRQMAALEQEARAAIGVSGKIKMTVAEMIRCFGEADP